MKCCTHTHAHTHTHTQSILYIITDINNCCHFSLTCWYMLQSSADQAQKNQQPSTICARDMMAYSNRGKNPHFPLIFLSFPRSLSPESTVKWFLLQYPSQAPFKKWIQMHTQIFRSQNIHITKTWQNCVRSGIKTHMHRQIACKESVPKIMSCTQTSAGTKSQTHPYTK